VARRLRPRIGDLLGRGDLHRRKLLRWTVRIGRRVSRRRQTLLTSGQPFRELRRMRAVDARNWPPKLPPPAFWCRRRMGKPEQIPRHSKDLRQ
jgi:hypothetical protein